MNLAMNLEGEINEALKGERRWRQALAKMDTGSYCEEASLEAKRAMIIRDLYAKLSEALLAVERHE